MACGKTLKEESSWILFEPLSFVSLSPPLLVLRLIPSTLMSKQAEYCLFLTLHIVGKSNILSSSESKYLKAVLSQGSGFIENH